MFIRNTLKVILMASLALPSWLPVSAQASSHMDAPLIVRDPAANTTDVYAFRSKEGGVEYLTVALGVWPFEEPGIGPNDYSFDPAVTYDIHVALKNHVATGIADLTYRFQFKTTFANPNTILQSYLGVVNPGPGFSPNQNLRQTYKLTKIDHRNGNTKTVLGTDLEVPPNNQGRVTPAYNKGGDGDNPAKGGVATAANLDGFTKNAIHNLPNDYDVFAGQRDDGFYADIHSIFDLDFTFDKPEPFDSQGGYNLHMMVLNIPLSQLGGSNVAGVFATTSRQSPKGGLVQVARQGNPLFNEALVAIKDKNKYGRSLPKDDAANFMSYATNPELDAALGLPPADLSSIFIPDVIKVDLTTGPTHLAGQAGFHRLSVFGGDTIKNSANADVPAGWPNGRRFGDDVVDIALIALGAAAPGAGVNIDKVTKNDITYNQVFPYAATPLNGRNHEHHN